jgi:hypothetical protein
MMKTKCIFAMLIIALVAMTSCTSNEDAPVVKPATEEQMQSLSGHWYAELPISGETDNWRSEEEGDRTAYDKIGTFIYLNGYYPDACYWGYLYLKDGDMVNFDGLHRRDNEANFAITMDSEGNIRPSSYLPDAPVVNNMRYANGIITADVNFMGRHVNLIFTLVDPSKEQALKDFYDILAEEGIVGGYADDGDKQKTDVTDENANEPSRARQL